MLRKLRVFIASGPEYAVYSGCYYGDQPEPPEYGCDVCVVEAYTKREAKIIALRHFLKQPRNGFVDCCIGQHVPYKHIELIELPAIQENPEDWWSIDYIRYEEHDNLQSSSN